MTKLFWEQMASIAQDNGASPMSEAKGLSGGSYSPGEVADKHADTYTGIRK